MQKSKPIFTREFYFLSASSFFFFMSFNMIVPELVGFIETIGGAEYKGWILALFTLVAGLSRPFSGKMADTVGRIPVMIVGSIVTALAAIFYIFTLEISNFLVIVSPVFVFLSLRVFHGMSTGFKPTGTAAYLADIVPENRRGEAMGWLGFAASIGMAIGPVIGNFLHLQYSYDVMFIASSVISILSLLTLIGIKETLPKKERRKLDFRVLNVGKNDFYEPKVIAPSITFFLYAFTFGSVYILIPDKAKIMNAEDLIGWFFFVYVIFTSVTRVLAGKISDKIGRIPVINYGLMIIVLAMLVLGSSQSILTMFIGGAIFGIAHGITGPTIFAWTTDLSNPKHRGRAFATMFIGMEAGIGCGSLLASFIFNNQKQNLPVAFFSMGVLAIIALIYLNWKKPEDKISRK